MKPQILRGGCGDQVRVQPGEKLQAAESVFSWGLLEALANVNWDYFGSLTFEHVKGLSLQWSYVWRLSRYVSEISRRPYRELLQAVRWELGEVGGRPHFHTLMGGTRVPNIKTLCHQVEAKWKSFSVGGLVEVRPYDPCGNAETYLIEECGWSCVGANSYEVRKFGCVNQERTLVLSSAVLRTLEVKQRISDRVHVAHA